MRIFVGNLANCEAFSMLYINVYNSIFLWFQFISVDISKNVFKEVTFKTGFVGVKINFWRLSIDSSSCRRNDCQRKESLFEFSQFLR